MLAYVILFALINVNHSLQCYACQSCNDPFYSHHGPFFHLPDNAGFNCAKEHTMSGINRGAMKVCQANNTDQWCCQTDLCNEMMITIA